jgi:hypothetical protein
MRFTHRIAVGITFGLAASAAAQEVPSGRATVLPSPGVEHAAPHADHGGVPDLTPPEFLRPPPPAVDDRGPAPGKWYAGIEFLYLTPRERTLDFALVDPANDLLPSGTVQGLNYKASPGIRVTLGYQLPASGWDVAFTYTYFSAQDEFGVTAPPVGLLYPTLTKAGLTNEAQSAAARAHLTMDLYDITAGRTFEVDEACRFRVFGGVRLSTLEQTQRAAYWGRDADIAGIDWTTRYNGFGPIVGMEGGLNVGEGFGLFAKATGGMLTGTQRNPYSETNNGGATIYTDLRDRFALTVPVLTLGVGVGYEYRGIFVRAGYEVTNFFNLFERPSFADSFAEGKFVRQSAGLALDGFFFQFGLSF